jgi:hypothetical protein
LPYKLDMHAGRLCMSHPSGLQDTEQLLRFVQRKWHQRRGCVLLLVAFPLFIFLAWSMTTKVCVPDVPL